MNIALLRSNPVAPDPRIEKEATTLVKAGHTVYVVCWDRTKQLPITESMPLKEGSATIFRGGPQCNFGGGISNIFKLIRFQIYLITWLFSHRQKIDAIHAADFDTAIPAWGIAKLFNKHFIYDIYDYYVDAFNVPRKLKSFIETIDIKLINAADAAIITNESRIAQLKKSNPKQLLILHNSPPSRPLTDKQEANARPTFAYIGVLTPDRLLIEIMSVFSKRQDWDLHIAGFGPLETEIRAYSEQYSNITFHGRVSYETSLSLSAQADILFATYDPRVPNHKFSSPNKLYEAMLLAKPLIVCNGTGIDDLVREELIGLSIPYDALAFESAADELMKDDSRRESMGTRAHSLFNARYSWDIMEKRLTLLYESLAPAKRPSLE